MNRASLWEVRWVVAVLAPWAISPHPNFKVDDRSGPSKLALVTERRDGREEFSDPEGGTKTCWEERLVHLASASLFDETQEGSTEGLWSLVGDQRLPMGARAAAALYGSLGLSELELADLAALRLSDLLSEVFEGGDVDIREFTPSNRLTIAALLQQQAMRLIDSAEYDEAKVVVDRVIRWLPSVTASNYDTFPISEGISWGPVRVQQDIVHSIKIHAVAMKAYLEGMEGDTWVRVVRARLGWVDMRLHFRSADRDGLALRDAYERVFESNSGTRHFNRVTAEEAGYKALLLAELSGHWNLVRHEREKQGKVLLLESGNSPVRTREALRLIRQANAVKTLQSAVAWVRNEGPSSALVQDALLVAERAKRGKWCTETDLLILEGASDFLSSEQRELAIHAALNVDRTQHITGSTGWALNEKLWKTLLRLVPTTSLNSFVASEALVYISDGAVASPSKIRTITRLIRVLEWNQVESEVKGEWLRWRDAQESSFENRELVDAIDLSVRNIEPVMPDELGLPQAAYLADKGLADGVGTDVLDHSATYLVDMLQAEADSAGRGLSSHGGLSTANVAAAFAFRFGVDRVWQALVDFLLDEQVDASLKGLALDRIARQADQIPPANRQQLRAGHNSLMRSVRSEAFFGGPSTRMFTEGIRFGAAIGALSKSDILVSVMKLVSSDVPNRIAAANTIPYALTGGDATWGHVLLLQLSHDEDPDVRAEAGQSLVMSLRYESELLQVVYERIRSLLGSDGVRVPLGVLHAIQRTMQKDATGLEPLMGLVRELTFTGSNHLVRGASGIAVELFDTSRS